MNDANGDRLALALRTPLGAFDLDFELETRTRAVGICGPSGSGKSSILECVAGWRPVREGRIRLGERTLLDTRQRIFAPLSDRGIGYVPQEAALFPHWNVRRNILCGRKRDAAEGATAIDPERVIAVLEIGALLDRKTSGLSGGERRRVALARALCSSPRFLLLDEPLAALDLPLRRRILPYLIRVRETFDLPMLFVSHDPIEVEALCDEVALIERGRIKAFGPPARVLHTLERARNNLENVLRGRVIAIDAGTARVESRAGHRVPRSERRPAGRRARALHARCRRDSDLGRAARGHFGAQRDSRAHRRTGDRRRGRAARCIARRE